MFGHSLPGVPVSLVFYEKSRSGEMDFVSFFGEKLWIF